MSDTDGKVNVLLVDDRPEKLLALEAVLDDPGQNIVRAYSGREALRHVLTTEFAVILLDVNMPGMDGFETASLIRQRKSSEHIPIIFVTAFSDEIHVARGYSLGAVDYIMAPVVPEVLRSKVGVFVELFRKNRQVRLQAESLRRRAGQLQRLAAASLAINSALSIGKMLQTVTDTAREVIGSHQAITLFLDPRPGQRPRVQAYTSFSDKYTEWRGQTLNVDPLASTAVFRSHTATRLTESELREHPDWEVVRQLRVPPIRGGMLAAPLTGRDGTRLGVIYLCDRTDGTFSADDEMIAVQLAQMASIAVENSLFAEEREANRIKDEFLSTLSHELRTPLNAILGWTQILQMEQVNGEVGHGLSVIERNARAQTKLIEDLLDVSRIATGKLRITPRIVPLAPIVQGAVEALHPMAEEKGVSIGLHHPDTQVRLAADPDRLQQVVWNLLSNAIKFTPSGGRVEVDARHDGPHVRIRVTDTGRGIDPAFLPHVFDRFRQADATSTRSHGGLGIGLTIVRHIVELHGGQVRAESAGDGQGSTFIVTLPVAAAVEPHAPTFSPAMGQRPVLPVPSPAPAAPLPVGVAVPLATAPDHDLSGVRVLIVDDEPDARDVLRRIVERAKATVETAATVAEARDLMTRIAPDLVVSDIAMPDEDGFAMIQYLRTAPPELGGGTPAIALTAYAREEDRQRTLQAGFAAHVAKPVEPAELIEVIGRVAARTSRPAPARSVG
jgi:signal transduction histidine kinase